MVFQTAVMTVMTNAAIKASRALKRDFGEVENLQVSRKGPADVVSNADLKCEKTLRDELEKARPGYGFLLEEGGEIEGKDKTHRWIIDPLDGTTNFLHGLPHFAISIALEREGELVAGLIYDPIKEERFWAEKGKGAYVNDRRIRVAARRDLDQSIFATGIPFLGRPGHEQHRKELKALTPQVAGIRRFGSAALDLAYVAAGRYDGFWERGLSPWDIAAGVLIAKEAGVTLGQINGAPLKLDSPSILAANDDLFRSLSKILHETTKSA